MFNVPRIRSIMAVKGCTQKTLAQKINRSERTVSRMFRSGKCGTQTAQLLVDALDISDEAAIEIFLSR